MSRGRWAVETPKRSKLPLVLAALLVILLAVECAFQMNLIPLAQTQPTEETVSPEEDFALEETSLAEESAEAEQSADPVDAVLPGEGLSVCVDPGHGGIDPGTHDPYNEDRLEKDDVLKLALELKESLEAQGAEVIMTRSDDSFPSLSERCALANEASVNYYISIHRNSASSDAACGVEIWRSSYSAEETSELGEAIMSGLERVGIQKNRGVNAGSQGHDGDYKVLRETKMPSLLLEMGFMQNEEDNRLFDEKQQEYAEAIAQAIVSTYQAYHSGGEGSASSVF